MSKKYSKEAYDQYTNNQANLSSRNALGNQYLNAVNQPTAADEYGDAFTRIGSQPAVGPAQRETNALLSGVGAGIKGYANDEKKAKLKQYEEQTAQLLAMDAELQQQMLGEQQEQQKLGSFFKQNIPLINTISEANLSGDKIAADKAARALFINYKNTFKDPTMGDYTGQEGGKIRYIDLETGNETGRSIAQFIYQSGIDPVALWGADAGKRMSGLSEGAANQHEKTELMDQYALQGASLKNQGMQADINYRNAQIGAMNTQNDPNYMQMQGQNEKQNLAWKTREANNTKVVIPEISNQFVTNSEIIPSIEEFGNLIKNSSLAGSSTFKEIKRYVAEKAGVDEDVINAKNYGQFYLEWMGRVTKGAISDKDMAEYKSTFAGIDKNPKASVAILQRLQKKLESQNQMFEKQLNLYEQDPGANLSSLDILSGNPRRQESSESPQGIVDKALSGGILLERNKQNVNIEKLREDLGFQ